MSSSEIGVVLLIVLISGIPGAYVGNLITNKTSPTSSYGSNTTTNNNNNNKGPVVSVTLSIILYIVTTTAACYTLTPETKHLSYVYGIFWGVCQGWMHPQNTTIYVTITPIHSSSSSTSSSTTSSTTLIPSSSIDQLHHHHHRHHVEQSTGEGGGGDGDGGGRDALLQNHHTRSQRQHSTPVEVMGLFIFVTQILSFLPPLVFTVLNENGYNMKYGLASLNGFFIIAILPLLYLLVGDNYQTAISQAKMTASLLQSHPQQQQQQQEGLVTAGDDYIDDVGYKDGSHNDDDQSTSSGIAMTTMVMVSKGELG